MSSIKEAKALSMIEKIQKGEQPILIDVRTQEEVAEVRVPQAKVIPLDDLKPRDLEKLSASKTQEIYFICRSGARSRTAARIALNNGYTNVFNVIDGTRAWQNLDPTIKN